MFRTTLALFGLLVLSGCQDTGTPQTTAERCGNLDMEIAATQENDGLQQGAKVQMLEGFEQQKAELNCP
jgi:hypothetical protein